MPAVVQDYPYVAVVVEREEPLFEGSNRYKAEIALYLLTNQEYNHIEDLIGDVKDYIEGASITDVLELTYLNHEVVAVEDAQDKAATKINVVLIYKTDNNDTPANKYPSTAPVGYMAIAKYKTYALTTSGSTTFQSAGTNVYDSHKNANLEIPAGSGSISVDIVDSDVVEDTGGTYSNELVDDNEVMISIRGHFDKEIPNTIIAPFMYQIVNKVRTNINLGGSYRLLVNEPFSVVYNQVWDVSNTVGAELVLNVNKYESYTQE